MTAPSGSLLDDPFVAHHGRYVFEYVADGSAVNAVTIKGPTADQPWAQTHMGCFAVPGIQQITVEAQFFSDAPFVVDIYAHWFRYSSQHNVLVKGPTDLLAPGYQCSELQWNAVDMTRGDIEYSHWRPRFAFASSVDVDGTRIRLDTGRSILIDCLFLPDNGQPVSSQPYLDGDQPDAIWEGEQWESTSIYGSEGGTFHEIPKKTPVMPETIVM